MVKWLVFLLLVVSLAATAFPTEPRLEIAVPQHRLEEEAENESEIYGNFINSTRAINLTNLANSTEISIPKLIILNQYHGKQPPSARLTTNIFLSSQLLEPANIRLPKQGKVNTIFHCTKQNVDVVSLNSLFWNLDFSKLDCLEWSTTNLSFNEEENFIEFTIGTSAIGASEIFAGGEIIATAAEHLGSDYTFISSIYPDVQKADGIWSESIQADEFVRVKFEQNLSNGSVIDFLARNNPSSTFSGSDNSDRENNNDNSNDRYVSTHIEVYEAGTNHFVGRSPLINRAEFRYITIANLSKPTDVFDLKVVQIVNEPNNESEKEEEDEDNDAFTEITPVAYEVGNVEFDYIHDDAINTTTIDGLVVYGESNMATPQYRTWNSSLGNFSAQASAQSLGVDGTNDITWVTTRANHERDEIILGTVDKGNAINIQIFNSSHQWGNLLQVSTGVPNSAERPMDIAIEEISGDVLIAYENSTTADSKIAYRLWNGTNYSEQQSLEANFTADTLNWIGLTSRKNSDEIMLLAHTSLTNDLYSVLWNGSSFDTSKQWVLSTAAASNTEQHFAFAWEDLTGNGLAAYGMGNNLAVRVYSSDGTWGEESLTNLGKTIDALRMCGDANSSYVGIIFQFNNGATTSVRMWNGSALLASPPTDDTSSEPRGTNNANVDCAWENNGTFALFGFVDSAALAMSYFNFTKPNTWGVSSLASAPKTTNFASNDIESLRLTKHPVNDQIMIVAMDINEDISALLWNGTSFNTISNSPIELSTEVLNGAQESVMFDWDRFDPPPSVKNAAPANSTSYIQLTVVNISANVTDNLIVDKVLANITMPNGTTQSLTLVIDGSNTYNTTFSRTNTTGTYTILFIANDTSLHQNYNTSVATSFTITTTPDVVNPSIPDVLPQANGFYNTSETVLIAANATDDIAVSRVFANISEPNSTIKIVELIFDSGNRYNTTFTTPTLLGTYNITFTANDSSNNQNRTVTTNFTVQDRVNPSVPDVLPAVNSVFNISDTMFLAANVTDDINVSRVFVNVSEPNGTIKILELLFDTTNISGNRYNTTFTAPSLLGTYNLTFAANDSSGNQNRTVITNFTVQDRVNPSVFITSPAEGSSFNQNSSILFEANVSDAGGVSVVLGNVSFSNGTFIQQIIFNDSDADGTYNTSFTNTGVVAVYILRLIANDTSNNINASETRNFTILDTTAPSVKLVSPTNGAQNNNGTITFVCNATDNIDLVNITLYHNISSSFEANLTNNVSGTSNQTSFLNTGISDGNYLWNCFASDNDGIKNMAFALNNRTFSVDASPPSVKNLTPATNSPFNFSEEVNITANVTDNNGISAVLVNVTFPNNTLRQFTLLDSDGNFVFNVTFSQTQALGTYNITIITNDTFGNINNTQTTNFTVQDRVNPSVSDVLPAANAAFNINDVVLIVANVTDNVNVSHVFVNISEPNGTIRILELTVDSTNSSGNRYNTTFTAPSLLGIYNLTFAANDSSGNQNRTVTTNFTIQDNNNLSVRNVLPATNSFFNASDAIRIAANVMDDIAVSRVFANISEPNSSIKMLELILDPGDPAENRYNTTFTAPALLGTYNITFAANDSSNNQNRTVTTNFTVQDRVNPSVPDVLPAVNSVFNISDTMFLAANVTDDINVSRVFANISEPNGTIKIVELLFDSTNPSGNRYNTSFLAPVLIGGYNITFAANDSSNNFNSTATTNFTITDAISPLVTSNSPVDRLNASSISLTFNFTAVDNAAATLNCSLLLNKTSNSTNSAVSNGSATTFTVKNFQEGNHVWNVTCLDASGNENSSAARTFTLDSGVPNFISLTTSPSSTDELDQKVNITILANVTDNLTAVQTIVIQRKLTNKTDFTNHTSVLNTSSGLSFASFNATQNGTYTIRLWANDTAGNSAFSNQLNISVEFDTTWTRSPVSFSAISATFGSNVTLGNLTLNNTGDEELRFNLTSDSNRTIFNTTSNFSLAAKEIISIMVNDSATVTGIKNITITINATTSSSIPASPASQTTSGTIVVAPGQPVLVATITTPSSKNLTVTRGDTNVALVAKLENIGEGNASNISFSLTIPADWVITFGEIENNFSLILPGDTEELSIQVTIPTAAATGTTTIIANSTGLNESGADLKGLGLIFSDNVTATVEALPAPLDAAVVEAAAAAAAAGDTTGGSGVSAGAGGAAGGAGAPLNIIYTQEAVTILRGRSQEIPLKITNIYPETILTNVQIDVQGFLPYYLSLLPEELFDIPYLGSKEFTLKMEVPSYFSESNLNLTLKIKGDLFALSEKSASVEGSIFDKKIQLSFLRPITEFRTFILKIEEVSSEDLTFEKRRAEACFQSLKTAGFPLMSAEKAYATALEKISQEEFRQAKILLRQICEIKEQAFAADVLLQELRISVAQGEEQQQDIPQTKEALELAQVAFDRADFSTALDRAKEGQLLYLLETKGKVDIVAFTSRNRGWLVVGLVVAFLFFIIAFRGLQPVIRPVLRRRQLKNLRKEEKNLHYLLREAQRDYLVHKKISQKQYKSLTKEYESRLSEIISVENQPRRTSKKTSR